MSLPKDIVTRLRRALGSPSSFVALHEPRFIGNEWQYLKECLDSTSVSSVGKFVEQFEADIASYTGAKYAVAVVNGTAALHIALLLAGVRRDDEVLVPTLTFVATANAVSYIGAMPHFVDSEEGTLGINPDALRKYLAVNAKIVGDHYVNRTTGRPIRAVVPVHVFGHPVRMAELLSVAQDYRLKVIEDASESLGSFYQDRHTATFGNVGILSFNGNKVITTGGGGAILTDDAELARLAKHLTTTAKVPHRWEYVHDHVGYNYRMPNLNAALGCAQLENMPAYIASKRALFRKYVEVFADIPSVRIMQEPVCCQSNYWLQALVLDEASASQRDTILAATNDADFMTRPTWTLMHRLLPFRSCPKMDLSVAESMERRIINLPSSAGLAGRLQ
jgi:aminotransferase in exopolysaccharide biosynthesis